jgi:GTPase
MDPELDDGCIEYKFKLLNKDEPRLRTLATQMRYRCNEGDGECIYNIGVEDTGEMTGITEEEYEETIKNINFIADKNNYSVNILSSTPTKDNKKIYEVLIREKNESKYIDIKVCIAGNADAGKSSLIGCLITGEKDNGRGLTRSFVFNYPHELKSGRTSSIGHQILGYDYDGKVVNYQGINKLSWPDIVSRSAKIVSFFDLAGHEKYLKTTILGLSSSFPDICMIIIDANNGIKPMTKEHILLCVALKIPFIIVITKIDICKERKNVLDETIQNIHKFLKYPGIRRLPVNIKNTEDVMLSIKNIYSESITPIFYVSSVSGEGIENLKDFLNIVNKKTTNIKKDENVVEFHIDHVFSVHGFGTVLGGHLLSGEIKVGDKLLIGPNQGEYENINIRSIYCKKTPLQKVSYGSYVCLGVKKTDKLTFKRGNVLISHNHQKLIVKKFTAKINVLRTHSTTIRRKYEPVFHAYAIRSVVKIIEIKNKKNSRKIEKDDDCLRNNDSAIVDFEFKYNPQFLKVGTRFILCEGKTKVIGEIIKTE